MVVTILLLLLLLIFLRPEVTMFGKNGGSGQEPEVKLWPRLGSHKVAPQPRSQCCAHSHITRANSKFSSHSPQNKLVGRLRIFNKVHSFKNEPADIHFLFFKFSLPHQWDATR